MARRCELTGKKYLKGNQVSHSNRKTRKRSEPNLQWRRVWVPSEGRYVRMLLSTSAIRTMTKLGVDRALRG
jgi:large subunit ribosomal protein L28